MKTPSALLLAAVVAASGCGHKPPPEPQTPMPASHPTRPIVDSGDTLLVEVFGEEDLSGKFQVSDQGTIDYPLVGRLKVGGLTPPQVSSLIRTKLADGYLKNPHVRVFAEDYQGKKKVFVWGQVRKSGTFNYTSGMRLIEALTLAGGLTPMANRDDITVTRNVNGKIVRHEVPMGEPSSATYELRPGDVIFVPERVF